jgi:2-dehydro-3-deoxygalactonokinase
MYIVYYDSGTTNTRAYLIKDGRIAGRLERQVGARNSALMQDNAVLVRELRDMFDALLEDAHIYNEEVAHIYLSGMISSPSGLVEVEHLPVPVDWKKLRNSIVCHEEERFFQRMLEIIPGIKTVPYDAQVVPETADRVNMMRGEEIEVFGVLRGNPVLEQGRGVLILPGSHTQAVLLEDGCIKDISSNITGELFKAVVSETILGASVAGEEEWEIDEEMVCLGANNAHIHGFNRALYILRILDLFTEATLNQRRSYLEGVLNTGVMDAVMEAFGLKGMVNPAGQGRCPVIRLAVAGDRIQQTIYHGLCRKVYPGFHMIAVCPDKDMPFSVSGLLRILGNTP